MRNRDIRQIYGQVIYMIPDMAGMSLNPRVHYTDTRSSYPDQALCISDFSYAVISAVWWAFISLISVSHPQHNHHRRTQTEVISLCLSMPWSWVNTKNSIHRVQQTPRTVDSKYSINRVQHPLMIVGLAFIHTIISWFFKVPLASSMPTYKIHHLQASFLWGFNSTVTLSHLHSWKLTNWWVESHQHLGHLRLTASKFSSNLASSELSCTSQTSIMALECSFKFTPSQSAMESPTLLHDVLQVGPIVASKSISELAWSCPQSAFVCILNHRLEGDRHQQNVFWSGSYTQTSQKVWLPSHSVSNRSG